MASDDLKEKRESEFGYREVGARELGLREWMFNRENRGFAALVNRLRVRKWLAEVRAEGGARLERVRASARRYAAKKRAEDKAGACAAERARRQAKYKASPHVFTCTECGATWCKAPWIRGPQPTFCGTACYQRARYRTNESAREQKKTKERERYATRDAIDAAAEGYARVTHT